VIHFAAFDKDGFLGLVNYKLAAEAYIFLAVIYFICCFYMSNFSRKLERMLDTGR